MISFRKLVGSAIRWVAAWTPLVAVYWGALLVQAKGGMTAGAALRSAARMGVVPGLLAVVVWWICGRLPIPDRRPLKFALAHAAIGSVFGVATGLWHVQPLLGGVNPYVTKEIVIQTILPWQIVIGLMLYGLIAAASYAIRGAWGARDLRLATERAERLQAQAELAVLRAHINPHFLFNTLHSVTQLLRSDPARAEVALERLSDLFRYALRLDRERVELVSLEDEWRFTSSYLWLEQMRMGDRLRVESSLSDDAQACAVPPFTLQPLVENAVRHGLGPSRDGGTIAISAAEHDGVLSISVSDTGVGADPVAVETGSGIGLRAVRQRLEARHNGTKSVAVVTAPGQGMRVTITLPAELAK